MSYRVIISQRAQRELDDAAAWIAQRAPEAARRWFREFILALDSLQENPERCGWASEDALVQHELRQLLHGRRRTYRAVFTVREDAVVILAIRHTAQQDLSAEELQ